jgi:hypothetical protein
MRAGRTLRQFRFGCRRSLCLDGLLCVGILNVGTGDTGCPESPRPIPISTYNRYEEANLVWIANILSIILSDPGKRRDPVPEHTLDVVKGEAIPYLCNRVLNFVIRGQFSISQDLL